MVILWINCIMQLYNSKECYAIFIIKYLWWFSFSLRKIYGSNVWPRSQTSSKKGSFSLSKCRKKPTKTFYSQDTLCFVAEMFEEKKKFLNSVHVCLFCILYLVHVIMFPHVLFPTSDPRTLIFFSISFSWWCIWVHHFAI